MLSDAFELPVHEYVAYFKASSVVCVNNLFEGLVIVDFLSSLIISIVPKRIALDSVTMNGILLMYIMSTVSVTFPCSSSIPSGRSSSVLIVTLPGVLRVVLPFSEPRFGPSMSSTLMMSCFVMGQFGIRPFSTYSI